MSVRMSLLLVQYSLVPKEVCALVGAEAVVSLLGVTWVSWPPEA